MTALRGSASHADAISSFLHGLTGGRIELALEHGRAPLVTTGAGGTVSVLRHDGSSRSGRALYRARSRGLPCVVLAEPHRSTPAAVISGNWHGHGSPVSAPVLTVVLPGTTIADLGWRLGDSDLIACGNAAVGEASEQCDYVADSAGALGEYASFAIRFLAGVADRLDPDPAAARGRLSDLVPPDYSAAPSARAILAGLIDNGSLLEIGRPAAAELITGFARVDGTLTAVLACRPDVDGGRLGLPGLARLRRITELASHLSVPLISVVDTAGLRWQLSPEFGEELSSALRSLVDNDITRGAIVVGRAYGLAAMLLGSVQARADFVLAWPRADFRFADEPASGWQETPAASNALAAARDGLVFEIVHPDETRAVLADYLKITATGTAERGA